MFHQNSIVVFLACLGIVGCPSAVRPDDADAASSVDGADRIAQVDATTRDETVPADDVVVRPDDGTPLADVVDTTDSRSSDAECDPVFGESRQCWDRYGGAGAVNAVFRCCAGRCLAATSCGSDGGVGVRCGATAPNCDFGGGRLCCGGIDRVYGCALRGDVPCRN